MARYTCSYIVKLPLEEVSLELTHILKSSNFDVIYETNEYLMGREIPGKVAFAKLVTIEILIHSTMVTEEGVNIDLVFKNEELPLSLNNHCRQIFQLVNKFIADNCEWQLLENNDI